MWQVALFVVGGLAVVALAVALCWLVLVYLLVPLIMITATAGALVGGFIGLTGTIRGWCGIESDGFDDETPDPLRRQWRTAPYPTRDNAWPHYLTGQLLRDVANTTVWPTVQVRRLWRAAFDVLAEIRGMAHRPALLVPFLTLASVFLVTLTVATAAVLLAAVVPAAVVALPGWTFGLMIVLLLRPVDYAVRWWRRAAAVCAECGWVTALPAYRCGSCGRHHHDVRPGALGLWHHRCACGAHLPTTALRASRVLTPACPRCRAALPPQSGVVPDIRIAVSGGPQVGKSCLLAAGIRALQQRATRAGRQFSAADPAVREPLQDPQPSEPAVAGPACRPVTIRTVRRHSSSQVHLFDPAGDMFLHDRTDAALQHLGTTRNHLFVIDPLRIPLVRAAESATLRADQDGERATVELIERPYRVMVAQMRHHGLRTHRCSLAVTVTKMDRLWTSAATQRLRLGGVSPPEPRAWLLQMNLDNLVTAAERDFGRVRYFFTGAPPEQHFRHLPRRFADPAEPFTWLIRHNRWGMGHR